MKYHYCYRISNVSLSKHYYGVRSSRVSPKNDLGIIYYSSSTDDAFIAVQKDNHYIFKYKIIKQFDTRKEAELFEIKLHKRFGVATSENFYNKTEANALGFSMLNRNHSEETKVKISKSAFGRKRSVESCKRQSETISGSGNHMFGKSGKEHPKYGYKMNEFQIQEIVERVSGSPWGGKLVCEHCHKEVSKGNFSRWHGNNCKYK